ncbi:hypothetical protein NQ318_009441 [Aromia moschata]|uniref:Uncharacterized protein n=1 Tax=Aromia moschata TaxID=1265417 RepID=A0AAV8Z9P6_9CUCU|nr:hypothetical protein NQ318_009441 [Aromia moschata]
MCPKTNKLFCFICLVMGGNRSAWTQEGSENIKSSSKSLDSYKSDLILECSSKSRDMLTGIDKSFLNCKKFSCIDGSNAWQSKFLSLVE